MGKNALLYVDGQAIKMVFGNSIKVVPVKDVGLDFNRLFLDKLFSDFRVFVVASVEPLARDQFQEMIQGGQVQQGAQPPSPHQPRPPARTQPRVPMTQVPMPVGSSSWIKSNSKTIIIIDDLFTDDEIQATGRRAALAIAPDKAVNLGLLNPENVKNSSILRSLLAKGIIEFTSEEEARQMDAEREQGAAEEMRQRDAAIDKEAGLVPEGVSAAEYARSGGRTIDEAQAIEVTAGPSSPQDSASGLVGEPETMTDLFSQIEAPPEARPVVEDRPVARARVTTVPVTASAKSITRKE